MKQKLIAEQNFFKRHVDKQKESVITRFPDIGQVIEDYVQQCNVGADAWHRTGILTFDGNTKVKSKVTYEKIRQHLIKTYGHKFSHGTVVQLCVAQNCRRRSAACYKGVAKVTSRRARKGFMMKFNPDTHWSAALYRGLNHLQYHDGRNILNLNRDDAAGFRLDTMATNRLHRSLMVKGCEATTTYTDYVNRYTSILQTTSYHFSKTNTTGQLCAGIVKPTGIYPKNPAQHMVDLQLLEEVPSIKPAFMNPVTDHKQRKQIECICVDGASDEGPSHEEVQFYWTERHFKKTSYVTLVTAHNSGSSYLNRVELQNGCLALAHANLFIPSTLNGSCMASGESGKIDREAYNNNMELAAEVYINRVNQCPCGDSVIHLFKGADSSALQDRRKDLLVYLKGSKKSKAALHQENPDLFEYNLESP